MSRSRYHETVPVTLSPEQIEEGLGLCENATQVNGWYPHGVEGNNEATVRGPWNRWFRVNERSPNEPISSAHDDVKFAAYAMNNCRDLLDMVKSLQQEIEELKEESEKTHYNEEFIRD